MTRLHSKIYVWLAVGLIGCSGSAVLKSSTATDSKETTQMQPGATLQTFSIDIPESAEFCGEKIDLTRYDLYERFDREITAFTYMHSNTLGAIKRANRYFPLLTQEMKNNGIPEDFVYLAYIESDMRPKAHSSSKAAGFWQLLPGTARELGLEVNEFVDERYDPVKATKAAAKYLKKAYDKLGNWIDVASSYNGGIARITSLLNDQKAESSLDLYMTEETYRYVVRIVAAKELLRDPRKYGFIIKSNQLYQPQKTKTIKVTQPITSLIEFAIKNGTTYLHLKDLNPWLVSKSLPNKTGKEYFIQIPSDESLYPHKGEYKTFNQEWDID